MRTPGTRFYSTADWDAPHAESGSEKRHGSIGSNVYYDSQRHSLCRPDFGALYSSDDLSILEIDFRRHVYGVDAESSSNQSLDDNSAVTGLVPNEKRVGTCGCRTLDRSWAIIA